MNTTETPTPLEPFARRRTALLTTFRRDGTGVDTPVTIAVEDGHAYIRTYDRAWKAKRMRNRPEVRIAPSTVAGRPRGASVPARVTLLDGPEAEHAARAIARRQPVLQGVVVPIMHRLKHYRTLHYRVTPEAGPPDEAA
jgi:PPOX class probable F420-dependent enzyme